LAVFFRDHPNPNARTAVFCYHGNRFVEKGGTYMPILLADEPAIDHKADWLLVLEADLRVGECR
jgi:hypothetical protein